MDQFNTQVLPAHRRSVFAQFRRGLILSLIVVVALGTSYLVGYREAKYDIGKRSAAELDFAQSLRSTDELLFHAQLLGEIRNGNTDGAVRVLELKAHTNALGAAKCLANEICTGYVAPTSQKQIQLRELVDVHRDFPTSLKK